MVLHFSIIQIVLAIGVLILKNLYGNQAEKIYMEQLLGINGIGNLLILFLSGRFYRNDERVRREVHMLDENSTPFRVLDGFFLLFIGASLSIIVNLALSVFGTLIHLEEYSDSMNQILEGKSILILLFWVGIIGPMTEELIFRWLVFLRIRDRLPLYASAILSGVIFGIYHGNLAQFVYATILGVVFALTVEWTGSIWSSFFLHAGANIFSILFSEYGQRLLYQMGNAAFLGFLFLFFLILLVGISFYYQIGKGRKRRV